MSNNNSSGGIGFLGLLAIVFIVLKLCKVIAWSWWWVLCPLWGPVAIGLAIFPFWMAFKIRQDHVNRFKANRKSKWQIRMEQMQEAQKLRENK